MTPEEVIRMYQNAFQIKPEDDGKTISLKKHKEAMKTLIEAIKLSLEDAKYELVVLNNKEKIATSQGELTKVQLTNKLIAIQIDDVYFLDINRNHEQLKDFCNVIESLQEISPFQYVILPKCYEITAYQLKTESEETEC